MCFVTDIHFPTQLPQMQYTIHDYIIITKSKNQKVTLGVDDKKKENILKSLFKQGYRKSMIGSKRIYYRRSGSNFKSVHFHEIQYAFYEMIKSCDFHGVRNVSFSEILNWFYRNCPIKQNMQFDQIMAETLTEDEIHIYLLQNDGNYAHKIKVQQCFSKIRVWNFGETIDTAGGISKSNPLYYKSIGENKFLIFSYYNPGVLSHDGFDSCIAEYKSLKDIGLRQPLSYKPLAFSFDLDQDLHLIDKYVN